MHSCVDHSNEERVEAEAETDGQGQGQSKRETATEEVSETENTVHILRVRCGAYRDPRGQPHWQSSHTATMRKWENMGTEKVSLVN